MPTFYVDRPFSEVVHEQRKDMQRERDDDVYVSDQEALFTLLSDGAQEQVERRRDDGS